MYDTSLLYIRVCIIRRTAVVFFCRYSRGRGRLHPTPWFQRLNLNGTNSLPNKSTTSSSREKRNQNKAQQRSSTVSSNSTVDLTWTLLTIKMRLRVQGMRGRKGSRGRGKGWRRMSMATSSLERMYRGAAGFADESEGESRTTAVAAY